MIRKKIMLLVAGLLVAAVCIAGCSVNMGAPATTTSVPQTVQTIPPTIAEPTILPVTATIVTTEATTAPAAKELQVLHETGVLTTKTYTTYDFKTLMGYKFLYPNDKFRI